VIQKEYQYQTEDLVFGSFFETGEEKNMDLQVIQEESPEPIMEWVLLD